MPRASTKYADDLFGDSQQQLEFELPPSPQNVSGTTTNISIRVPSYNSAQADTARIAGRVNAAAVSDSEYLKLLAEREAILKKKLTETGITKQESNRLEYVRWTLDRIEDARHGSELDRLESHITEYEKFVQEIKDLQKQLARHSKR